MIWNKNKLRKIEKTFAGSGLAWNIQIPGHKCTWGVGCAARLGIDPSAAVHPNLECCDSYWPPNTGYLH